MTRSVVDHLHISRRDAMASGIGSVSLAALGGGIAVPAAITTVPVTINQDMKALRFKANINPAFIAWLFEGLGPEILGSVVEEAAHGTRVIRMDRWRLLAVPVPPADEQAAIDAVKPGVRAMDLDKTARDVITEAGYGEYFTHRLGHGLGISVHEFPSLHGSNEMKLEEGMVFTIEPGIYHPDITGVRIEDDVVVTSDGVEVLTKFPKELQIIG